MFPAVQKGSQVLSIFNNQSLKLRILNCRNYASLAVNNENFHKTNFYGRYDSFQDIIFTDSTFLSEFNLT